MLTSVHRAWEFYVVYTTNVLFNLPVFGGSLSMISISVLALAVGMRTLPLLDNRLMSTRNISLSSLIVSSTMSMDACWDCCSPEDKTSGRFTTLWKSSPAVKRDRVQIRVALTIANLTLKTFALIGTKCHQGTKVKNVKGQRWVRIAPPFLMMPSKLVLMCIKMTSRSDNFVGLNSLLIPYLIFEKTNRKTENILCMKTSTCSRSKPCSINVCATYLLHSGWLWKDPQWQNCPTAGLPTHAQSLVSFLLPPSQCAEQHLTQCLQLRNNHNV